MSDSTGSQAGDPDLQEEGLPSNATENESGVETIQRRILAA